MKRRVFSIKHAWHLRKLLLRIPHFSNDIPILIVSFNNPTFVTAMVEQVSAKQLGPIIILDSHSTYPPMVSLLLEYEEQGIGILRFRSNVGPRYIFESGLWRILPKIFVFTDPDLRLSKEFSREHLNTFAEISQSFNIGKVGCTLSLRDSEKFNQDIYYLGKSITDWESQFWKDKLTFEDSIVGFRAIIDTTFALYNKRFLSRENFFNAVRIDQVRGADVSAEHLPWYLDSVVPKRERDAYMELGKTSGFTSWGI
jgi:hypothetical protein